jgi:sulfotransferase family protein
MKKVLIYSVHKAGTMFLHYLTNRIAQELGINYVSISDDRYHDEIQVRSWNVFIEDDSRTGCFGPIRGGEGVPSIPENLGMYSVLVHMRDPRDALTSLYYSYIYSHGSREGFFQYTDEKRKKWEAEGIDRFVLNMTTKFKYRYEYICSSLIRKESIVLLKYEDMITDFEGWLKKYLTVFSHCFPEKKKVFDVISGRSDMTRLYKKLLKEYRNEFDISKENVHAHKRQVMAGDHKRKLKPETINILNNEFYEILDLLDYTR